jgi:DUF4097 and DUF4098 domain-containing protein YvlB
VVEIKGVNGDVEATAAAGAEVEVTATKKARKSDVASVEIKVIEHAEGVTVCAVYPSSSSTRPNECAPGEGGRMNTRDNDVSVHFSVRVPRGVRFAGRTVNGGVDVSGVDGDVVISTVNGGVHAASSGHVRAETVNGSIAATMGKADWTGPLELRTVNGGITLDLPGDLSTEVKAETVNGSIETDFPLTVQGRWSRRRLSGTIGGGGRDLHLETVNGSIRLRKGR